MFFGLVRKQILDWLGFSRNEFFLEIFAGVISSLPNKFENILMVNDFLICLNRPRCGNRPHARLEPVKKDYKATLTKVSDWNSIQTNRYYSEQF